MTSVSISQLKTNPAAAIAEAQDYPLAVQNRNDTAAYLVGKSLFEKIILHLENAEDKKAIQNIDIKDKKDFEDFVASLDL